MNEESYTVLQGKVCIVTLKGMAGTNYKWCLASMPEELVMLGAVQEAGSMEVCGGTYQEHFYFVAKGCNDRAEIKFEWICLSDPSDVAKTCTVELCIIPADSNDFVDPDDVMKVENVNGDSLLKYGYVCGMQADACCGICDPQNNPYLVAYGIRSSQQMLKYGYPCGVQDSQQMLKYGYPCGVQGSQQMVKYGYPCGVQDSQQMVKYGYPCGVQDNQQMIYGYPCGVQDCQ